MSNSNLYTLLISQEHSGNIEISCSLASNFGRAERATREGLTAYVKVSAEVRVAGAGASRIREERGRGASAGHDEVNGCHVEGERNADAAHSLGTCGCRNNSAAGRAEPGGERGDGEGARCGHGNGGGNEHSESGGDRFHGYFCE